MPSLALKVFFSFSPVHLARLKARGGGGPSTASSPCVHVCVCVYTCMATCGVHVCSPPVPGAGWRGKGVLWGSVSLRNQVLPPLSAWSAPWPLAHQAPCHSATAWPRQGHHSTLSALRGPRVH